jgi:hypothetical protein
MSGLSCRLPTQVGSSPALGAVASGRCPPGCRARAPPPRVELRPGDEEQHLPVARFEVRQRRGQSRAQRLGVEPAGNALAVPLDGLLAPGAGQGAVAAHLRAAVTGDEVARDAVQPRGGVGLPELVAGAAVEGDQERLGRHVVGQARAQPPRDVAVDRRVVAVEYLLEALGVAQRALDQDSVGGIVGRRPDLQLLQGVG